MLLEALFSDNTLAQERTIDPRHQAFVLLHDSCEGNLETAKATARFNRENSWNPNDRLYWSRVETVLGEPRGSA